jgi:GTP-binding protein
MIDLTQVNPESPLDNYNIIMKELEEYNPVLAQKPMLIVANKIDIVGVEEAFFSLENAFNKIGKKCFSISAAAGEGLKELLEETFRLLDELGDDFIVVETPQEDFVVVDESTEDLVQFNIEKVEDYFVVTGKAPERMVKMLDLNNDEAVYHLQQRLKRMGVEEKLKEMGVKEGDFVVIGDYEFNYFEEK